MSSDQVVPIPPRNPLDDMSDEEEDELPPKPAVTATATVVKPAVARNDVSVRADTGADASSDSGKDSVAITIKPPTSHTHAQSVSLIGLTPIVHAVLAWLIERVNIDLFASPPHYSDRLSLLTCLAFLALTVANTVIITLTSMTTSLLFSVAAGFLLSQQSIYTGIKNERKLSLTVKLFAIVAVTAVGFALYAADVTLVESLSSLYADRDYHWLWDALALALWLVYQFYFTAQQRYLLSYFRNPLHSMQSLSLLRAINSRLAVMLCQCYLIVYYSMRLSDNDSSLSLTAYHCLLSLTIVRAYHSAFNHPTDSLTDTVLVLVIDRITSGIDFPVKLLIAGILTIRIADLRQKWMFMMALIYSTKTETQWAKSHPLLAKRLPVLLIPYHLLVLVLSVALALPLIELFGSKVFGLSLPRPQRVFLTVSENSASDTGSSETQHYYQHLQSSLLAQLPAILRRYHLGYHCCHTLMVRCEPYTLLVQLYRLSSAHCVITIKGMEMEMTSCHTRESLTLDENIAQANADTGTVNPIPLHSYQLLDSLTLENYCPSTVSLVGILDDKAVLELIAKAFYKNLIFFFRQEAKKDPAAFRTRLASEWRIDWIPDRELARAKSEFPLPFYQYAHADTDAAHGSDSDSMQRLIQCVYALVYTLPPSALQPRTTSRLFEMYGAKLPASLYSEKMKNETKTEVKRILFEAFRFAVKIAYDASVELNTTIIDGDDNENLALYYAAVADYQTRVKITVNNDSNMLNDIRAGYREFFTLASKNDSATVLQAHTLSLTSSAFAVLSLNYAGLQSIWSSMLVELLWFGNDDDERASIQANEWLLRNMSVQAAETPMGYAAYYSGPLMLALQ